MRAFFKLEKFEELISSSHHNKVANSTFLSQQKFEMGNHVLFELVAVFRKSLSNSFELQLKTEKLVCGEQHTDQ